MLAPLIFNTFVKPFFRLIRFDNLLFLIILIGVMEKWVVAPIMNHFLLPEPLLWWHLLLLIVAVVCIAAGGYVINDYFDVKIDRINHPDELVVTREVTKEQAMHLFYGFTAVGIASGVALSIVLKSTALFTVFVLIPGLLWFYSASYKRQFLLGNLIVSVLAALVPITVGLAGDAAVKLTYGEDSVAAMLFANVYIYLLFFAAFAFLCADIDKTDLWVFNSLDSVHINAAHGAELAKHLRAAFHICPKVKKHIAAVKSGNYGGKCRPLNSLYALYNKGCADDDCAGAACADIGVALSVGKCFKPDGKGAFLIALHNLRRLCANRHNKGCVDKFKSGNSVFLANFAHFRFVADGNNINAKLL